MKALFVYLKIGTDYLSFFVGKKKSSMNYLENLVRVHYLS